MKISIPELSLVLLVGPSGCGKSSFARKHFLPTEIVSSDFCRALVSDNENDQSATGDAFDLLHEIVRKRLAVESSRWSMPPTSSRRRASRSSHWRKNFHLFAEAIVFDLPERLCQDRNALSPGPAVWAACRPQSVPATPALAAWTGREGIRHVFKLSCPEEVDSVTIERQPLWNNKKSRAWPVRYHRRRSWLL